MLQLITEKPAATFVTMTKPLVDALLTLNTRNRPKRDWVVANYKRALENDFWAPTNQGVGVAASGFLIDGQHRLEALRDAGYPPVLMLIVTGLPDEAAAAVDAGANRNARDYLHFLFNTKVSAFVSAILRASMMAADGFAPIKYTPQEFAAHLEKLGTCIGVILALEHVQKMPASVVAALVDAHSKGYESEVLAFAKALATGEMLERDNPALLLRNWIASTKGKVGGAQIQVERYRKTTRALQAWIDQRPLGKLYRTKSPLTAVKERAPTHVARGAL